MYFLLLGAGPMAEEYARILKKLNIPLTVVGRSQTTAAAFEKNTGYNVHCGGYQQYFADHTNHSFTHCIVAVSEDELGKATRAAIRSGIKNILVEKPGGIDEADIREVNNCANEHQANVFVGYNRRFFASVEKCREIIIEDGGLQSFNFEFTEWGHVIRELPKQPGVKENWFLANSSHVIDLAFFIGGLPQQLSAFTRDSLDWHPRAAIYTGAGVSTQGALFSYQANWQAPGRWGLEFLTAKHRLILKPMEKLHVQNLGSVAIEEVSIDDALDVEFKPGLYNQVQAFIHQQSTLPTIAEQAISLPWYEQINQASEVACLAP